MQRTLSCADAIAVLQAQLTLSAATISQMLLFAMLLQAAAEELACQVDGGVASAKLAWKWACYAAAEAAAGGTPGARTHSRRG